MVTTFLSPEEVRSYLCDLVGRLVRLDPQPEVICAMARSGTRLLEELVSLLPEYAPALATQGIQLLAMEVDESSDTVRLEPNERGAVSGKRVLLLDGAIHSGRTMGRCVQELAQLGAAGVCTYALVIKRSCLFVPTFWGLMIDDADRAYYLLDPLPNNRLEGKQSNPPPYAHLRLLNESDAARPQLECGVKSMDRVTWGDRLFDMRTNPHHRTFVLEAIKQNPESGIVGYITINQEDSDFIQIDEVAVNPSERGKSYGPLLVRFAENLARHGACKTVRLFSIENRVKFYQDQGYKVIQGDDWIALDDEHYIAMGKRILHHITR